MVSGWLASPQSTACLSVVTCVCVHMYTRTLYTRPRPCTHRRTDAFQTLHQLQNWNFSINNNYYCQRTDATSRSLLDPEWFSSVRLKSSIWRPSIIKFALSFDNYIDFTCFKSPHMIIWPYIINLWNFIWHFLKLLIVCNAIKLIERK